MHELIGLFVDPKQADLYHYRPVKEAEEHPATNRSGRVKLIGLALAAALLGFVLSAVLVYWFQANTNGQKVTTADIRPRVAYIGWDENDRFQLFSILPNGSNRVQLSGPGGDVRDFAVSPGGEAIVYSSNRADGAADLWIVGSDGQDRRRLLDCSGLDCSNPSWSPDGRRLVFEQRELSGMGSSSSPASLMWLDIKSGATLPVFEDEETPGAYARFSPDGQWLSFIAPQDGEIQAYNLETGALLHIPSQSGEPAVWDSEGKTLLVTQADLHSEHFAVHIYHVDLESGESANLSGELETTDGWPVWSPDGAWIAFNRKMSRAPMGKQLYLTRSGGDEVRQLTSNAEIHHGPPRWSPDGRFLAFQRFFMNQADERPGIWLIDIESGEMSEVAAQGIDPAWLP